MKIPPKFFGACGADIFLNLKSKLSYYLIWFSVIWKIVKLDWGRQKFNTYRNWGSFLYFNHLPISRGRFFERSQKYRFFFLEGWVNFFVSPLFSGGQFTIIFFKVVKEEKSTVRMLNNLKKTGGHEKSFPGKIPKT